MKEVTFSVPFVKGLQRHRMIGKYAYDPKENIINKKTIAFAFKTANGYTNKLNKYKGEVHIRILAECTLPESTRKSIKELPYLVKPDADNIAKLVLDGLNKLAFADDSCVVALHIYKAPRTREKPKRTTVQIRYPNLED